MGNRRPVHGGFSQENSISFFIDGYIISSINDKRGDKYRVVFALPKRRNKPGIFKICWNLFIYLIEALLSIWLQVSILNAFGTLALVRWFEIFLFICACFALYLGTSYMSHADEKMLYNHGAEHKVYNAAGKVKGIPTLNEARKASRYSPWCGIKTYTLIICLLFINVILTSFNQIAIPLILVFFLGLNFPGIDPVSYIMQKKVTTREPGDDELELALAAYKAAVEISEGRMPTEDEAPTANKAMDALENMFYGPCSEDGKLDKKQIEILDNYYERMMIEKKIVESVFGNILTWFKEKLKRAARWSPFNVSKMDCNLH